MSDGLLIGVADSPRLVAVVDDSSLVIESSPAPQITTRLSEISLVIDATSPGISATVESQELLVEAIEPARLVMEVNDNKLIVGVPGAGGGGVATLPPHFLPPSDMVDDSGATYFYFGWFDALGGWLVRRQLRVDATTADASVSNNPGYANLTAAWATKETLTYA